MDFQIDSVFIVGSGNVAFHLGNELFNEGVKITGVFSRNKVEAEKLASICDCESFSTLNDFPESDLVVFCVPDDSVEELAGQIKPNQPFVYTAGALDLTQFSNASMVGVFYPLQTFSKHRKIDLTKVPFFIEAKEPFFQQALFDLAWKLSRNVHFANSETRKKLHVAAVFINNFTNHLAFIADDFLHKNQLSMEVLLPLLDETVAKLQDNKPLDVQTGPARRGDQSTIKAHELLLEGNVLEVYQVLTKSIQETYKSDKNE